MCVDGSENAKRGRSAVPSNPLALPQPNPFATILLGSNLHGAAYAPVFPTFFFRTSPVYRTPFCLYGSGLRMPADVGRDLPDKLAVDPGHRHVRLLIDGDVDARRHVEHHRMRIPEREDRPACP